MAPQFPALRLGEISPNRTTVYNIKINLSRIFPLFVLFPLIAMSPNRNADCNKAQQAYRHHSPTGWSICGTKK